jgi:FkbM family methyltransferase
MNFSAVPYSSSWGRALRLPLRLIPADAVLRVLQGPLRGMKWIAGSGNHGCWLGTYEHHKQLLFHAAIERESVVWDIGANVGLYSLVATRKASRVIAVEPLAENVRYLERHITLNGIRNVEVLVAAVGHKCGRESFYCGDNRSTGRLAPGSLEVDVVTLDSLCVKFGAPDVIKIDVEGAEYLALQGAERCLAGNPIIFLATHSATLAAKCSDLLASAGYVSTGVGEDEFVFSRHKLPLATF